VTDRIWPCVELQWEWLGGLPRLRRAAVIGAGSSGTTLAVALAGAGIEVDLGCRTGEQAIALRATRRNDRYLPGVELPASVHVERACDLELAHHDLVCFAVPSRALPAVAGAYGEAVPERAGVLVLSSGLVAPLGTLPSAYAAERTHARAVACLGGPRHARGALEPGASLVVASADEAFRAQLADVLAIAGFEVERTADVTGVELAGAARSAALFAAAAAGGAGSAAADAAAAKVFAEVDAYARSRGGRHETFAGLAGSGDVVATAAVQPAMAAEALDALLLLAGALREGGVYAPAVDGLAAVVEGRVEAEAWAEAVTAPTGPKRQAA
jgi:glycerol-3-phosphate dehydrogenase